DHTHLKSDQILIVQATPGAISFRHYGAFLHKGNKLVTFIYEKLRSCDLTRALSKVKQVLEIRSFDLILACL
ncbi:hypothetical protein CISIN_1g042693mg, partial [Citrus sinensis]